MNFCVTDGESVIATRYISSRQDEAASLVRCFYLMWPLTDILVIQWYSSGTTFSEYSTGGHYKMTKADKRENIIMVGTSCCNSLDPAIICLAPRLLVNLSLLKKVCWPFSHVESFTTTDPSPPADWMEIKTNHIVVITPKMNLLQIPIVDKFYVPPSDPAALARDTDFAEAKGLLYPRKSLPSSHIQDKPST
jgi:glutamine amidotransferase